MAPIPVFLIDDSEPDRLYTSIVLSRSGVPLDVHEFESAADALSAIAAQSASAAIILLDINMPGMDGFAFLDAYERLPLASRGNAVVVMLSSSPLDSDRDRALAHAVVKDYVVKPLTLSQAHRLLQRHGAAPA